MKMKISEELLNYFKNMESSHLVLDFDHSLSKETVSSDCCGITRYRLIILNELPSDFDGELSSNIGKIYMKNWGKVYLDEEMTLRRTASNLIELVSDSSILANNLEILDFRK